MIKVQYADPAFQNHGYWNHVHHLVVDCGVYPGTTDPLIELYKIDLVQNVLSTSGTGGKPRNIALFRKVIPTGGTMTSGVWEKIRMWQEFVDYDDSSSAASITVHPITGNLHVVLSFGKPGPCFQEWEEQINRSTFAPPIVRLPSAIEARLTAIETALGNVASGGLDAGDREALSRLRAMLRI